MQESTSKFRKFFSSKSQSRPKLSDLFHAIEISDYPSFCNIVSHEPQLLSVADNHGRNALHLAAQLGKLAMLNRLMSKKLAVNVQDNTGHTPLHWALLKLQEDSVWLLTEHDADVSIANHAGQTALHLAAQLGFFETLDYWLNALPATERVSVLSMVDRNGHNALHYACISETVHTLRVLLKHGANPNVSDKKFNTTPLHSAVAHGRIAHVYHLLKGGANIDAENNQGITALCLAEQLFKEKQSSHPQQQKDNSTASNIATLSPGLSLESKDNRSLGKIIDILSAAKNSPEQDLRLPTVGTPVVSSAIQLRYPIKNLVFEGGGARGLAYIGAIEILAKQRILSGVEKVAGSSVGAITAMIVSFGMAMPLMKAFLANTQNFTDGLPWDMVNRSVSFLTRFGLSDAKRFRAWANDLGYWATGIRNINFRQLHDLVVKQNEHLAANHRSVKFRDLFVTGANLTTGFHEVFSYENTAEMPIADAVRISMSCPLAFSAVHATKDEKTNQFLLKDGSLDTAPSAKSNVYVDGGVMRNFPIGMFDQSGHANPHTLGLRVDGSAEIAALRDDLPATTESTTRSFVSIITQIQRVLLKLQDDYHRQRDEGFRTIYIDTHGTKSFPVSISEKQVQSMMENGEYAASMYLRQRLAGIFDQRLSGQNHHAKLIRKQLYQKALAVCYDKTDQRIQLQFGPEQRNTALKGASRLRRQTGIRDVLLYKNTRRRYSKAAYFLCYTAEPFVFDALEKWCQKYQKALFNYLDESTLARLYLHEPDALGEVLLGAAKKGDTEKLLVCIQQGCSLYYRSQTGDTALHIAARAGHEKIIGILLEKDSANIVMMKNGCGELPIHCATQGGNIAILQQLYNCASRLDVRDIYQRTPLHTAISFNQLNAVKWLLHRRVLLTARDESGNTPLALAIALRNEDIIQILEQHPVQNEVGAVPSMSRITPS